MRNPKWTEDEIILALDLYFSEPDARGNDGHPACLALSDTLKKIALATGQQVEANFRNPNSIGMKLRNFAFLDEAYAGKGLPGGSKLDERTWQRFAGDPAGLHNAASQIRAFAETPEGRPQLSVLVDTDSAGEGAILTAIHQRRERDPTLIKKKKSRALDETGRLACEACGFDFARVYGERGRGFAECHHDKPVSQMVAGDQTHLEDLRILCANCHRMIHRQTPWLTVAQLRVLLISSTKA